jgi:hypothetical protein
MIKKEKAPVAEGFNPGTEKSPAVFWRVAVDENLQVLKDLGKKKHQVVLRDDNDLADDFEDEGNQEDNASEGDQEDQQEEDQDDEGSGEILASTMIYLRGQRM